MAIEHEELGPGGVEGSPESGHPYDVDDPFKTFADFMVERFDKWINESHHWRGAGPFSLMDLFETSGMGQMKGIHWEDWVEVVLREMSGIREDFLNNLPDVFYTNPETGATWPQDMSKFLPDEGTWAFPRPIAPAYLSPEQNTLAEAALFLVDASRTPARDFWKKNGDVQQDWAEISEGATWDDSNAHLAGAQLPNRASWMTQFFLGQFLFHFTDLSPFNAFLCSGVAEDLQETGGSCTEIHCHGCEGGAVASEGFLTYQNSTTGGHHATEKGATNPWLNSLNYKKTLDCFVPKFQMREILLELEMRYPGIVPALVRRIGDLAADWQNTGESVLRYHYANGDAAIFYSGFIKIPSAGEYRGPSPEPGGNWEQGSSWFEYTLNAWKNYIFGESGYFIELVDEFTGGEVSNALSSMYGHEALEAPAEYTGILDPFAPEFGIPEDEYEELLEEGLAIGPCDAPLAPFEPEECPPCVEDPEAIVPDWRYEAEGDVFLNGRTCEYCVTVNSGEVDAEILNDEATREAFLYEQKAKGVNLILEFFSKSPLEDAALATVLEDAEVKEYHVPLRPLMPIRSMVCVSVELIESIQVVEAEVEVLLGPIGCVLEAPKVRTMVKQAREALRYYGHRSAMWSQETNIYIPNFDPAADRKKLKEFIPILVQLMARNGFKLNGKNAAEKIEFRFSTDYEVIFAQANEPGCEPIELLWEQGGDNLGGFKAQEPINDPRTMAYISALVDLVNDAGAREPNEWDEFFAKYTYPPINVEDVIDPVGPPAVMADGPLQQAAQAIVDEIVSLPQAVVARFSDQVCRDRDGKPIHDASLSDFDDMLKRAIYSKGKMLRVGDNLFLDLAEILSDVSNISDLYQNVFNKLGQCGFLDLLSTAFACLTNGIDLTDSLSIIVRAALKAMDPGNLEKLFAGLPPEAQLEIKNKIAEEFGSIPAPWEAGYKPGSYNYAVEVDENGLPKGEDHTIPNPDYNDNLPSDETTNPAYIEISAENDDRTLAEVTAQYRMEAQGTIPLGVSGTSAQFGGAGSVGTAAANVIDAIFDAYIDAIMDSVDAEFLLEQLGQFPGAELVTKILMNPDCPAPPLFNPPLNEFMKTLELDFCRNKYKWPVWPRIPKFNVPDFLKMLMEAFLEVLMQVAIQIIMIILELILKLLLNGLCNLLGLLGDLVAGLFENEPSNQFADSIKDSISNTGLDDLGNSLPLADDDSINRAAADLFAAFSRSCQKAEDLPTADEAVEFLREIGLILTQGEFIELMNGVATREVIGAVYQLVLLRHKSFLCIFPNPSSIVSFFKSLGNMIDPRFKAQAGSEEFARVPVFPSTCSDVTGAALVNDLRRELLEKKGLNADLIDKQLESLKCRALSDLESLMDIAQNGVFGNVPPIMDDYSDPACPIPGLLPRDPSADLVPGGPYDVLIGDGGMFAGMFDILEKRYYRDMMGRGGFLNMVLSDRDGRNLRAHHSFVAFQAILSLSLGKSNTHQVLLPETVGAYLQNILSNPEVDMNSDATGYKFLAAPLPDLKLQYCNYYSSNHRDFYHFEINAANLANTEATTLDNSYSLEVKEWSAYSFEAEDEDEAEDEGILTEVFTIEGDPGFPVGVEELIEEELGLDIEYALAPHPGSEELALSSQAAVFGKYIEKILRDNINPDIVDEEATEEALEFIADACMTDIYNYVGSQFFNFLVGVIAEENEAFKYGEGGVHFEKNMPTTYAPTKIDLDIHHRHPVTGEPQPLDPLAWGGNENFPAFYLQPPQNRPGWCGIADRLIPEVDACDPKRTNLVRFDSISDEITDFYGQIADDDRVGSSCATEEPCHKILSRSVAAMIEGNMRATIRIYAAEAFLKGAPCFIKFRGDMRELFGGPMSNYISQTLKDGFFRYSKKGFGRRKNDEYYYQFLEQAVQNFGRRLDAGMIEATPDEQEALDIINSLQMIWRKDTDPASGKPYAGTGERLQRELSPGFFGAQVANIARGKDNKVPLNEEEGAISKAEARKIKEEAWDYFMREIEPQAELILSRYISEELEYVSKEFAERIPPVYRTLYEVFLGSKNYGAFGNLQFDEGSVPIGKPSDEEHPFAVPGDMLDPGTTNLALMAWLDALAGDSPNPMSTDFVPPSAETTGTYWPFALENYILIEDLDESYFTETLPAYADGTVAPVWLPGNAVEELYGPLSDLGVPLVWEEHVKNRPANLFGVVKASEWKEYLDSKKDIFKDLKRSDLWANWSYGLRIVFVPPSTPDEESDTSMPSLEKAVQIKEKIRSIGAPFGFTVPFTEETIQNNKAFSYAMGAPTSVILPSHELVLEVEADVNYGDINIDPMNIPIASGTLPINMDVAADDVGHTWYDSYEESGGFAALVQNLACSPEYKMLFRYCFNMPRILSVIGIYIIKSFVPSIGRSGPLKQKDLQNTTVDPVLDPPFPEPPTDVDNDGWVEPSNLFSLFKTYYGGGLGLSPFALNFKRWEHEESFKRSKKLIAQTFMDLYNSEDDSYKSDAFNNNETEKDARGALNVTWPKFSVRLWRRRVARPYDKDGNLCFNPDEDYSDAF
jgi:hypothetical protein